MCFGIRISSPFDLNTLNIPIQNIKCPKNTKNHFLPSHYLWSLNCVVFAQACQTQSVWPAMLSMNHIVTQPSMLEGASKDAQSPSFLSFFRCNALCRDMWSKMKVITEFCYFFFKAWNVLPCVSPIISLSFQSSEPVTEGWWDARGEDNIVQHQQWRRVLIFNSHRSLGSPLSSLSSSWSVVQVLLAVLSLLHQPRRWWDNSTLHSRGLSWPSNITRILEQGTLWTTSLLILLLSTLELSLPPGQQYDFLCFWGT